VLPSHPSALPTLTKDNPAAYSSVACSICARTGDVRGEVALSPQKCGHCLPVDPEPLGKPVDG